MPVSPSIFGTTNFDANSKPTFSVIFDANGMIDEGPIPGAAQLGYTASFMDGYLENGFASLGYSAVVNDVSTQFPGATYHYAPTTAQTAVDNNGGSTTTIYNESGIRGGNGSEVIFDTGGDDIFDTRGGDDLIVSFGGNNAVKSGGGDDVILLGDGDDVVLGGSGHDWIVTRGGDDAVRGGSGDDFIDGMDGNDLLQGGRGADVILGGAGADALYGNRDADDLSGGAGSEALYGGSGGDRLDGGADNDLLTGGSGADTFVFALGTGGDRVNDYRDGQDVIEIDMGLGLTSFGDVQGAATQVGSDVVIQVGSDALTLMDTQLSVLDASDFSFV